MIRKFLQTRYNSPIIITGDVERIIIAQSIALRGVTLKNLPQKFTINICPNAITVAIIKNPLQSLKWNAERFVAKARALNMFQNCKNTKVEKKNAFS